MNLTKPYSLKGFQSPPEEERAGNRKNFSHLAYFYGSMGGSFQDYVSVRRSITLK